MLYPKPRTYRSLASINEYRAHHRTCEVCGRINVHIHHIKTKGAGGDDHHDNLIALCWLCHDKAHNDPTFKETIRRRKGATPSVL